MLTSRLRNVACLLSAAVCCACWYACSLSGILGRPEPGPFLRITTTQSGEYMRVRLRRRIAIDLPEKAGYKWVLTEKPDGKVLKSVSYEPAREQLEGAPMQIVYFYAVGQGVGSLRFDQIPEGGGAAVDHFSLTLYVAGDEEFK